MLFEGLLRQAKRNHKLKGVVRQLEGQRTDMKKAFQIAYDRSNDTLNIKRFLSALSRFLRQDILIGGYSFDKFVDTVTNSVKNPTKSFNDTVKGIQQDSKDRIKKLTERFESGADTLDEFALAIKREADHLSAVAAILGGVGSSFGDEFNSQLDETVKQFRDSARSALELIMEDMEDDEDSTPLQKEKRTRKAKSELTSIPTALFGAASRVARNDKYDGLLESDITDEDLVALARQKENFEFLIERFGHVPVERRLEIKDNSICPECIKFAKMGWQLRLVLPDIGQESRCRRNCRCRFFTKKLRDISKTDAIRILRKIRKQATQARKRNDIPVPVIKRRKKVAENEEPEQTPLQDTVVGGN